MVHLISSRVTLFCAIFCCFAASGASPDPPYRFLLVVSDQWKDPASFVIEDGGEFPALAALMKSWGLPFEILRLDRNKVAAEGAAVLLTRGPHPCLTVKEWSDGGRVVWLGAHRASVQIRLQLVRDLFKSNLVRT